MSDDLHNRGPRDRERINVHESWELTYWTKHFGVNEAQLRGAVLAVGVMVKDVKRYLGK